MISLVTEYFLAIALFFSFITLIFYGFPVAWTMGGLGVLFIFISMISDNLFDTFYGVDFGFASMARNISTISLNLKEQISLIAKQRDQFGLVLDGLGVGIWLK